MALDPVSAAVGLGSALITLPGSLIHSLDTILEFRHATKNAKADVQKLLRDLEGLNALSVSLQFFETRMSGDADQWKQRLGTFRTGIDDLRQIVRPLEQDLSDATLRRVRGKMRKYFSSKEIQDQQARIQQEVQILTMLMTMESGRQFDTLRNTLNTIVVSQGQFRDRMFALEACVQSLAQSQPSIKPPCTGCGSLDKSLDPCTQIISKTRNPVRNVGQTQRTRATESYSYATLWIGRFAHRIIWGGLSWKRIFSCQSVVPRTSPGFIILKRYGRGDLFAEDAFRQMKLLASQGKLSFQDIDPDGCSYLQCAFGNPSSVEGMVLLEHDPKIPLLRSLLEIMSSTDNSSLLHWCLEWSRSDPRVDLLDLFKCLHLDPNDVNEEFIIAHWKHCDVWSRNTFALANPDNHGYWAQEWNRCRMWRNEAASAPDPFHTRVLAYIVADSPDFGNSSALHHAVIKRDETKVERLIKEITLLAHMPTNFLGQNALHFAVLSPSMLKVLLQALGDQDWNLGDAEGITPLMYAAAYGQAESFEILLEHGGDPFAEDRHSRNALHFAALCRDDGDYLLDLLHAVGHTAPETKSRAAMCMLRVLAVFKPEPFSDDFYETLYTFIPPDSLASFSWGGNRLSHLMRTFEELQSLIQIEPSLVNVKNEHGYTPAIISARDMRPEVLETLVDHGANIPDTDEWGMNAMHHLIDAGLLDHYLRFQDYFSADWLHAARVLLEAGIDLNQGDHCQCPCSRNGCSPIRALLWREEHNERFGNFMFVPRLLEIGLMVHFLCPRTTQDRVLLDLYRIIRFKELRLTHTCCWHAKRSGDYWDLGSREVIGFADPLHRSFAFSESDRLSNWAPEDLAQDRERIGSEQSDLSDRLKEDCQQFLESSSAPPLERWSKLIGRHADLLRQEWITLGDSIRLEDRSRAYPSPRYTVLEPQTVCGYVYPALIADHCKDSGFSISFSNLLGWKDFDLQQFFQDYIDRMSVEESARIYGGTVSYDLLKEARQESVNAMKYELGRLWDLDEMEKDRVLGEIVQDEP